MTAKTIHRWVVAISTFFVATAASAQVAWNDYRLQGDSVLYQGQLLADADAPTFAELGYGYGRDRWNVYYRGEVLEFVNPATFEVSARHTRHHKIGRGPAGQAALSAGAAPVHPADKTVTTAASLLATMGLGTAVRGQYVVEGNAVSYEGHAVKEADAATFEPLRAGYARDRRRAYYMGRVVSGALGGSHFRYIGDDYATDGLHTYFKGREVSRD